MYDNPAPSIYTVPDATSALLNEYGRRKAKRLSTFPSEANQHDKPILVVDTCLSINCNGILEDIFGIFRVICEDKKHDRNVLERTSIELCMESFFEEENKA